LVSDVTDIQWPAPAAEIRVQEIHVFGAHAVELARHLHQGDFGIDRGAGTQRDEQPRSAANHLQHQHAQKPARARRRKVEVGATLTVIWTTTRPSSAANSVKRSTPASRE